MILADTCKRDSYITMHRTTRTTFLLLILVCLPAYTCGEEPAEEPVNKPLISQPVRVAFADNFNRIVIGDHWRPYRLYEGQQFQLVQGVLVGKSAPDDPPRGAISSIFKTPCRNLGVTFRFMLGEAKTVGIGIGGTRGESGYAASVLFNKNRLQINANRNSIAAITHKLDADKWHQVMIEVVNNRVVVQLNGEKILDADDITISRHPKTSISFVVVDGHAAIDDIIAGEVRPK